MSQFSVLPTDKAFYGTNPERPIARSEQTTNVVRRQALIPRWLPLEVPDPIEAKQAQLRTQPKISVRRLGDRHDLGLRKAFIEFPRLVRVLTDVECRIQREHGGCAHEHRADEQNAQDHSAASH